MMTIYYVYDSTHWTSPWSAPYRQIHDARQALKFQIEQIIKWRIYCSPKHPVKKGDIIATGLCIVKVDGEVKGNKFNPLKFEVVSTQEEINKMVDQIVDELEAQNERR